MGASIITLKLHHFSSNVKQQVPFDLKLGIYLTEGWSKNSTWIGRDHRQKVGLYSAALPRSDNSEG